MTRERQLAINLRHKAWNELNDAVYLSESDDNEKLEKEIIMAKRFIMSCKNMILENKQKDGVAI